MPFLHIVFPGSDNLLRGIYLFGGGQLSALVDSNTPVPQDAIGRTFVQFIGISYDKGSLAFVGSRVINSVERFGGGELGTVTYYCDISGQPPI